MIYPGKPKALNRILANGSRSEACSVKTKTISTECQKEGKVVALACDEMDRPVVDLAACLAIQRPVG